MCAFYFIPVLFGTWNHIRLLGPELMPCPRCHNMGIQSITRRRWMTAYFIPLVPISRRRQLLQCSICRWEGIVVDRGRPTQNRGHRHRHRHHSARASAQPPNTDTYLPGDTTRAVRSAEPRPVSIAETESLLYATSDYQPPPPPPPPPYSKVQART
ncbi:hypothetical protein H4R21_002210 [Coemansia helicoidea]|uniref:Uncharacterized protein n=1 Tax=Coemansia helicoidea TaxID=1286919 RepID=A0ACC1L912_9FUNG|nr:hypothetical protein H4R21_002210 [Coemansia helicoidea]